jgi:hypothetical protein
LREREREKERERERKRERERGFGGIYCLHLQGQRICQARNVTYMIINNMEIKLGLIQSMKT